MSEQKKDNRYISVGKNKEAHVKKDRKLNSHVVFGVTAFLFVLVYLVFSILQFTFEEKTTYTFAEHGQIVESETFDAIVIRDETVYYSAEDGPVHYFALEGDKVKMGAAICLVDKDRIIDTGESVALIEDSRFSSDEKNYLNGEFNDYIENVRNNGVSYIDHGREKISNATSELYNAQSLNFKNNQLSQLLSQYNVDEIPLYQAEKPGIVSFYLDGYEQVNIDNVTSNDLNTESLEQFSYTIDKQKNAGEVLYKIIGNNDWYVYAKVSNHFADYIKEKDEVTVSFHKKDLEITGEIREIYSENDQYYVKLGFSRYLSSFITDREVAFTISYKNYVGLKIPNSSVISTDFVEVPSEAVKPIRGQLGVNIVNEAIDTGFEFHAVSFYFTKDESMYIQLDNTLTKDSVIRYDDNDNIFKIHLSEQNIETHEGVYVINKGYAVFSLIETLVYTEDYRIIEANTRNGVMMYDRIAADAETIIENEINK